MKIINIMAQITRHLAAAACTLALTLTLAGCVNDLVNNTEQRAENKETKKTFNAKAFAGAFTSKALPKTKTEGKYKKHNEKWGVRFYWQNDDYERLYVNMGGDKKWQRFQKMDTLNMEDDKLTSARFYLYQGYQLNKESYPIWYSYNGINNNDRYTNIPYSHYQATPNKFTNLYQQGDCGFATAVDNGVWYEFTLQHATSYLTFMPYAGEGKSKAALQKCLLTHITFTSDEANYGQFYFDEQGQVDKSRWPSYTRQTRIIYCVDGSNATGFSVPGSKEEAKNNAAIMVMAPGTYHNVEITYTLYDPVVQTTGVFKRQIPQITLTGGKNKEVFTELVADDYTHKFGLYHMWGASLHYWQGAESNAHHNWQSGGVPAAGNSPSMGGRYFSTYNAAGVSNIAPMGSIDRNVPSANFMSYYVRYGDPRWDDSPFTYDGHLFTGRMWFKKRRYFAQEAGYTLANMDQKMNDLNASGSDFRMRRGNVGGSVTKWEDVPKENRSHYFCVMPLGYYDPYGRLYMTSNYQGRYWTSTSMYEKGYGPYWAYALIFGPNYVYVAGYPEHGEHVKSNGYQQWPGEDE